MCLCNLEKGGEVRSSQLPPCLLILYVHHPPPVPSAGWDRGVGETSDLVCVCVCVCVGGGGGGGDGCFVI